MPVSIAIDGPVGAGKSTIADDLACSLGFLHLDTGAMYRAFGLKAVRLGLDMADAACMEALMKETSIDVRLEGGSQRTLLDGEDVTALIRTPEISRAASLVSKVPGVRKGMVSLQRACAQGVDIVLEGRDIGTNVLPDASFKFYLNASAEARAMRRWKELAEKGTEISFEQVLSDVNARDDQDMHREIDPLRCAEDAVEIDTTSMTRDEVVALLAETVRKGL